ncbi:hypothetical protein BSKO_08236 [Bryopsis sp. KO-2023]|nr:hypothetical protein BSKO_08236 [Bryopsis sp. KO-2023]
MDSSDRVASFQKELTNAVTALQGVVRRYNGVDSSNDPYVRDSHLFYGLLGVEESGARSHPDFPKSKPEYLAPYTGFQPAASPSPPTPPGWEFDSDHADVQEPTVGLADVPLIAALTELRELYKNLDDDPLWRLALMGSSAPRSDPRHVGSHSEIVDWDAAIFEFAESEKREQPPAFQSHPSQNLDAVDALLQFAQLSN